jgi:hypothetical protein
MSLRFCLSNIAVLINMHSIIGVHLLPIESCPRNTHNCIPCYGANINAFQGSHRRSQRYHLPVNVKKAVALEVLTTFLEELQSKSVNLCTREWLPWGVYYSQILEIT